MIYIDEAAGRMVNINEPYKDRSCLDTAEIRAAVGVVGIEEDPAPDDFDYDHYERKEDWEATQRPYIVYTRKSDEQIDAIIAQKAKQQAKQDAVAENAENATVKYLTSHTPAQIATYVQNNVTDLASAKVVIARLAIAVGSMLR